METVIANRDARKYVNNLELFKGSNIFSMLKPSNDNVHTTRYVVYSYGTHFPMYICEIAPDGSRQWYRNIDKYSPTTSKHMTQCRPDADCLPMDTNSMRRIAMYGIKGVTLDLPMLLNINILIGE